MRKGHSIRRDVVCRFRSADLDTLAQSRSHFNCTYILAAERLTVTAHPCPGSDFELGTVLFPAIKFSRWKGEHVLSVQRVKHFRKFSF